MPLDLLVTLVAGFLFVALVAGYGASALFSAWSPERRRLRQMAVGGPSGVIDAAQVTLVDTVDPETEADSRPAKVARRKWAACGAASPGPDTRA